MQDHDHDHDHLPDHDHGHHDQGGATQRKLLAGLLLTVAFVAAEAVSGFIANSLALLSDAGHNLADAAALGLSWYALRAASKPSHGRMTFGYHRVGILAALINALVLVLIAIGICWEGVTRLRHPEEVSGGLMTGVAAAAVAVNLVIGYWLHKGAKHDINVRSAYLHMIGDALSAVGVVIAGLIVMATGAHIADSIVSFLIAGFILWSSWGILQESVSVLLEATPKGLKMDEVVAAIEGVPGVLGSHDLHVWTVGPGAIAASVHVMVADQAVSSGQGILRAVVEQLHKRFNINHATVQVEAKGHCADELYCRIEPIGGGHVGHHH